MIDIRHDQRVSAYRKKSLSMQVIRFVSMLFDGYPNAKENLPKVLHFRAIMMSYSVYHNDAVGPEMILRGTHNTHISTP